jgi:drug/metabolite transporter (DMT)-like permease
MSLAAIGLALAGVSAVASLSAHAMIKSGPDKFAVMAWSQMTALLIVLPFAFWVGLPEPALLPWLFAGWLLHTVYYLVIIWSYSSSDFTVAYPVARGVVPILTAILGISFLNDSLHLLTMAGILVISSGILLLLLNQGLTKSGLMAAGIAGLLNTLFSLVDAKGIRLATDTMNFLVWYYTLDGIAIPVLLAVRSKGKLIIVAKENVRKGFTLGVTTLFAFLPALIAFRLAPVGAVSAIRATSVIFSLLLGAYLLKERLDGRRIGGAVLVTLGALAIIAGSAVF